MSAKSFASATPIVVDTPVKPGKKQGRKDRKAKAEADARIIAKVETPAIVAQAQAKESPVTQTQIATTKAKVSGRLTESGILAKHTHMVPGTLVFIDPDVPANLQTDLVKGYPMQLEFVRTHLNKQCAVINTVGLDGKSDGQTRWLATSDLHQVFWTESVKKQLDKINKKARKAERKALGA